MIDNVISLVQTPRKTEVKKESSEITSYNAQVPNTKYRVLSDKNNIALQMYRTINLY
jgi:hypothetical protein